jgi:2',3'-cyclic-nucleotide 2'-phosphodiesterase
MCGDYDSIIGMDKNEPVRRFLTRIPSSRFTPATGPATVCGVLIETDDTTGLAVSIEPLQQGAPLGGGRTRRER